MRLDRLTMQAFLAMLSVLALTGTVMAADLRVSAQVDRTTMDLGTPFTLTITFAGDISHAKLKAFEFPEAFQVAAQSRASNVAFGGGGMQRSTSLIYVLTPRQVGTFQLGPFEVVQGDTPIHTDPIEITVKKPVVPPQTEPVERFTL